MDEWIRWWIKNSWVDAIHTRFIATVCTQRICKRQIGKYRILDRIMINLWESEYHNTPSQCDAATNWAHEFQDIWSLTWLRPKCTGRILISNIHSPTSSLLALSRAITVAVEVSRPTDLTEETNTFSIVTVDFLGYHNQEIFTQDICNLLLKTNMADASNRAEC